MVGQAVRELNTSRLQLDWIKVHANLEGNERADELARNAVYAINTLFDIQPPTALFKEKIKNKIRLEWCEEWETILLQNEENILSLPSQPESRATS